MMALYNKLLKLLTKRKITDCATNDVLEYLAANHYSEEML